MRCQMPTGFWKCHPTFWPGTQLFDRVQWLSDLPKNFSGVIVANEVLDALPIERFLRRASGVFQLCVAIDDKDFTWLEKEAPDRLAASVRAIEEDIGQVLPDGYTSEVSMAASSWIADLAGCLERCSTTVFPGVSIMRRTGLTDGCAATFDIVHTAIP